MRFVVILNMRERLGNQLFQYSFARNIMNLCSDSVLVINDDAIKKKNNSEQGWINSLDDFSVIPYLKDNADMSAWYQKILLKINWLYTKNKNGFELYRRQNLLSGILNKFGLYIFQDGYIPFRKPFGFVKNKILVGYFEAPEYFKDIDSSIRNELKAVKPVLEKNISMLEAIQSTESICVTVRRGDFLNENISKDRLICTVDYYIKGIEFIKEKYPNALICFFSDDIDWVKNNIKVKGKALYESGNDPVWEKLRLMSSCKHFVISNSTFSWWAQHLAENKEKIVIAPSRWCNDKRPVGLYEKNWTIL